MKHGVKETEEALVAILQLGLMLWKTFHDGFQMSDVGKIWDAYRNNKEFADALDKAFEGYQNIPAEIKDLELEEAIQLAEVMLKFLPKYLNEIK